MFCIVLKTSNHRLFDIAQMYTLSQTGGASSDLLVVELYTLYVYCEERM